MSNKSIYELDLHEYMTLTNGAVVRVPGGWLYCSEVDSAFVPFDNEFIKSEMSEYNRTNKNLLDRLNKAEANIEIQMDIIEAYKAKIDRP